MDGVERAVEAAASELGARPVTLRNLPTRRSSAPAMAHEHTHQGRQPVRFFAGDDGSVVIVAPASNSRPLAFSINEPEVQGDHWLRNGPIMRALLPAPEVRPLTVYERCGLYADDHWFAAAWLGPDLCDELARVRVYTVGYRLWLENGDLHLRAPSGDDQPSRIAQMVDLAARIADRGHALASHWKALAANLTGHELRSDTPWSAGFGSFSIVRARHRLDIRTAMTGARDPRYLFTTVSGLRSAAPEAALFLRTPDLANPIQELRPPQVRRLRRPLDALPDGCTLEVADADRISTWFTAELCDRLYRASPSFVLGESTRVTVAIAGCATDAERVSAAADVCAHLLGPAESSPAGPYR